MLSIARSRHTRTLQLAFLIVNGAGAICSIAYPAQVPDLYAGNSHHKLGWAVTWLACIWTAISLVHKRTQTDLGPPPSSRQSMNQKAMEQYRPLRGFQSTHGASWSTSSGESSGADTASPNSLDLDSGDEATKYERVELDRDDEAANEDDEKQNFSSDSIVDQIAHLQLPQLRGRPAKLINMLYIVLERSMIPLALLSLITGIVTYSGIGRSDHIFNVLAHLIKGGIFFCYGILTFGRWMGCFSELGWAWNLRPGAEDAGRAQRWRPSAEFVESFVIFFYGASNVFLEHLGAWGKVWTAMDFEHVSITVVFFGGGLVRNERSRLIPRTDTNSCVSSECSLSLTRYGDFLVIQLLTMLTNCFAALRVGGQLNFAHIHLIRYHRSLSFC